MNRRDFIARLGLAAPGLQYSSLAETAPCPPSQLSLSGKLASTSYTSCKVQKLPMWYTNQLDGTWGTIATVDTIDSVRPSVHPGGVFRSNGPIAAWGGAALDIRRNELIIPAQGGHNDYYGNEVYSLAVESDIPLWKRLTDPRYSFGTAESCMDDGSPRSVHSASQIVYAENVDMPILMAMPFTAPFGNSSRKVFAFNREGNVWIELQAPPAGTSGYATGSFDAFGGSCYDPITGNIWMVQTSSWNSTVRYDPVAKTYEVFGLFNNQGYDGYAVLSPIRRCMVYLNGSVINHDGSFVWLDIANPTAGWRKPKEVIGPPLIGRVASMVWHDVSKAFIGWRGKGAELVKLIPPDDLYAGSWRWEDIVPSSNNEIIPSDGNPTGTYGRFNIISNIGGMGRDCLVLVNSTKEPTYVYKIPSTGF